MTESTFIWLWFTQGASTLGMKMQPSWFDLNKDSQLFEAGYWLHGGKWKARRVWKDGLAADGERWVSHERGLFNSNHHMKMRELFEFVWIKVWTPKRNLEKDSERLKKVLIDSNHHVKTRSYFELSWIWTWIRIASWSDSCFAWRTKQEYDLESAERIFQPWSLNMRHPVCNSWSNQIAVAAFSCPLHPSYDDLRPKLNF